MTMRTLALAFVWVLVMATAASAEPTMTAIHNGSLMTMTRTGPSGMVIQYAQPRPDLLGLVGPGTVLVQGHWEGLPPQIFVGEARVFSRYCGSIPYPVRGVVDATQSLMLFGAAPQFDTACRVIAFDINRQQAVLRFEPPSLPPPVAQR